MNDPEFMELPIVSSNGFATVVGFAKLMGVLAAGGRHGGKTLMSAQTVDKLTQTVDKLNQPLTLKHWLWSRYIKSQRWVLPTTSGHAGRPLR